jgi:hypothetical protein
MDELKLLSQLHDDISPPTSEAIDAARSRLDEAVGAAQRSPLAERTAALRPRRSLRPGRYGGYGRYGRSVAAWQPQSSRLPRRPLRLVVAGGLALALGIGAALGLQPESQQHRQGPGSVRLAAWTVTKDRDGELIIHLRQLRDPQGLRDLLRRHGVAARIEFPKHDFEPTTSQGVIPSSCKPLALSDRRAAGLQGKIFDPLPGLSLHGGIRKDKPLGGFGVLGIRARAIPSGVGIFWQVWASKSAPGTFSMDEDLVQVSQSCTGGS